MLFFSLHTPICGKPGTKTVLEWTHSRLLHEKNKSDFFTCHWSHRFLSARSWLLYSSSVSPAGHCLYLLYYQSAFTSVWCQLPFIPFLDFLTNSYMEWGEGRECWFSHLLCSMFCENLEATLTARMLSCKKELPNQSNTLPSPNNVPLRYGRCQALRDLSDEEPILEELEEWSLIPNRPWVSRSPWEIDANSPRLPTMLWSSPIKAFITGTEWRLSSGRRRPGEVTARW